MLIKVKPSWHISENEITPEATYLNRRQLIAGAGALAVGAAMPGAALAKAFGDATKTPWGADEELTDFEAITTYNNFYEFGTDKRSPARDAHKLTTDPWSIKVEGACAKPGTYALEDVLKGLDVEERIYRLRCVETWSMVIPWNGVSMADLLKKFEPTSDAKYVAFETLYRPKEMWGQRRSFIDWPYVEGLRMDEAMHPLTIAAIGLYGDTMPKQNGAPIRLVVPWKYGFKSIKSIVAIRFVKEEPPTSWNISAPNEYGFYANVNPTVDHPRWSQKSERRIGDFFKMKTRMYNGYAQEVANLYKGMDLEKYY